MSLSQVKKGKEIVVQDLVCQGVSRQRLTDLGIFKGSKVTVKGFAPLGDPMIIEVNDCEFAIRKSDAENIEVRYENCSGGES